MPRRVRATLGGALEYKQTTKQRALLWLWLVVSGCRAGRTA